MLSLNRLLPKRNMKTLLSRWSSGNTAAPILGCGSNVVDVFFRVRAMPVAGTKGYFQNPTKVVEGTVVGGVTLNHLSWAAALGAPTGLLALQGDDDLGTQIRQKLESMGVSTAHIKHGPEFATSVSHILLDKDGERAIIMAPASTGTIVGDVFRKHFEEAILADCKIATTEISQLPLSGAQTLLDLARSAHALSFLDVDVPPSVAVGDAGLGNLKELYGCVSSCDVMKPTLEAAAELLSVAASEGESCNPDDVDLPTSLAKVAEDLLRAYGPKLVAVTDGKRGCGLAIPGLSVEVAGFDGIHQVDSTGAGDAFFGGLVAGVYRMGLPSSEDELRAIGKVAGTAGGACCEVLGALPEEGISRERIMEMVPEVTEWVE